VGNRFGNGQLLDKRLNKEIPYRLEAQIVIEEGGSCAKTPAWSMRPGFLNRLPICVEWSPGRGCDPGETLAVAI
jgi:hypothetical protein